LIYGAGDSGIITYGALNRDTKNNYEIVGFIDDDDNKINKKIDRLKICSFKKIENQNNFLTS
jgi:FlaA1/EpsC-like NDP-sugar epimerase